MARKPEKIQFIPREEKLRIIRSIADYQFGKGAGRALFPDSCKFIVSPKTGRIRQIIDDGVRIATLKTDSGLFSLSIEGARRLHSFLKFPSMRVVVLNDVASFISDGKNVFAKHVVSADRSIRAGDEVLVVDENDNLLATGKAVLGYIEMMQFERGMAVSVRVGIKN
jgi:uncharacterized protein with predicted RNA binding PUA domain